MCNCCCNTENKGCYQFFIIFISVYILAFQSLLIAFAENNFHPEEIETFVLSERPLFDFEIGQNEFIGKKNITFFEFKGREKRDGNKTITYDEKSFTKIYGYKFLYNGKDRNYFDYKNKYSVSSGQNCPSNYKKCGILDSKGRILCLPNEEQCPLNGFGISKIENDSLFPDYDVKKADYDIYFYFTNKATENKIITEFKLSYGFPCAKATENHWIQYYSNEVTQDYSCITKINGNYESQRYSQVQTEGIDIFTLYQDNGLLEEPMYGFDYEEKVYLYVRNYNEMDESCVQGFLDDLENENKYYDSVFKTIRVLTAISLACTIALSIYIFTTCACCCNVTFNGLAMIIPIYGMIVNIVTIGVINKERIRYKCQLEGFNETIDDLVDEQYNNYLINFIMSIISLVLYSLVFVMTLCLKFMKSRVQPRIVTSAVVPITPMGGMMPQAYPVPITYGRPKMIYENMMPAPSTKAIL